MGDEGGFTKHQGKCGNKAFGLVVIVFELFVLASFAIWYKYDTSALGAEGDDGHGDSSGTNEYLGRYALYQDVHVMIFIGFGFLMTFLRKYGFSSVGLNMAVAAFTIQWAIVFGGPLHNILAMIWHEVDDETHGFDYKLTMDVTRLVTADFAAGAVLISFGAVLGRVTPMQLFAMAALEIIPYTINEFIGVVIFQAVDMGGSIFVHTFGAYFGLGVALAMGAPRCDTDNKPTYVSDMFAMIGTIFLWMFWPSFNGALAPTESGQQERVVVNTVLALTASCVITFAMSKLVMKGKFSMVHIQNATLAGGVAVGSSSDLVIGPYGAIIIGLIAGTLSTVGYEYIDLASDKLPEKLRIHDTCGVNNLHGMPGILGAVGGAISVWTATHSAYNGAGLFENDRLVQGFMQLAALGVTLVMSFGSGLLSGFFLGSPLFDQQTNEYSDIDQWLIEYKNPLWSSEELASEDGTDDEEAPLKTDIKEENTDGDAAAAEANQVELN